MIAVVAGCRGEPPASATPTGPTIQLTIDDAPVQTVVIDRSLALASLLEVHPAAWLEVRGEAVDERSLELWAPATRYPGSEVRLYLDQGQPALGLFPPVTPDMAAEVAALARQPTASLTTLASVHVVTRQVTRPGLIVVGGGREITITREQLRALPALQRGASRAEGWPLSDVIELASPTVDVRTVRIEGAGEPIILAIHALRDPAQIIVLKQNQRGEYVVRMWEPHGRSPTRELRRVTRIVVD